MVSPRIEYAVLSAGEGPGQDRCFTADGLVVVLDGASAIDPVANPDATEYVDTLGPVLVEQITGTPDIDLREALAEAIRLTAHELALVPGTAPSSTVSIVRWGDEWVDVLVLGDSPVLVQFSDGHQHTIVQHPQDHIAPELRHLYRERLVAGHGYDDEHRSILALIQRREAASRNREDGYFIAEAIPAAAQGAATRSYSVGEVLKAVVATDGVDRPATHLGCLDADALDLDATGLRRVLSALTRWEADVDADGRLLPRSKRHDDKTLAVLTAIQS